MFANTLKVLRMRTRNAADHLALKPTATIPHAPKPTIDTNRRAMLHVPWIMKPKNKKISRTRPASKKLKHV